MLYFHYSFVVLALLFLFMFLQNGTDLLVLLGFPVDVSHTIWVMTTDELTTSEGRAGGGMLLSTSPFSKFHIEGIVKDIVQKNESVYIRIYMFNCIQN